MRSVALSEAKDHLSEFVAAAQAGEEVIITRHGKPAAKLVAIAPAPEDRADATRTALEQLAAIRAKLRAKGMTATVDEMIRWKNEGRP